MMELKCHDPYNIHHPLYRARSQEAIRCVRERLDQVVATLPQDDADWLTHYLNVLIPDGEETEADMERALTLTGADGWCEFIPGMMAWPDDGHELRGGVRYSPVAAHMWRSQILTVGYERRTQAELIETLVANDVTHLLDVRARPISRKPGLSKAKLAQACEAEGIGYTHLRELGNPDAIRKAGLEPDEMWRAFRAHLEAQPDEVFASAEELYRSARGRICLLCYERVHTECHRSIVADVLAERIGCVQVNPIA